MTTLLIARDFPPDVGGVQTVLGELSRRMPGVFVLARRCAGDVEHDRGFPAPIERLNCYDALGPLGLVARQFSVLLAVRRAWRRRRFALVIAGYLAHGGPVAWLWFRLFGVPYVVFTYGTEIMRAHRSPLRFLWRRILADARVVAAIAEPLADWLRDFVPKANIVKIPLGRTPLPAPRALPEPYRGVSLDGCFVMLSVGRLVPRKGVDTALRALAIVKDSRPDLVYVVAGDGPDRDRLTALANQLGVAERVVFAGRVSDEELSSLYARCDVFVMASRVEGEDIEGFGLVFVDAGAYGKPVIGGRSGGVSEAVRHEGNGLLVDPKSPQDLAAAIQRVAADPDLAARLGAEGRRRADEEFTFDRMVRVLREAVQAR